MSLSSMGVGFFFNFIFLVYILCYNIFFCYLSLLMLTLIKTNKQPNPFIQLFMIACCTMLGFHHKTSIMKDNKRKYYNREKKNTRKIKLKEKPTPIDNKLSVKMLAQGLRSLRFKPLPRHPVAEVSSSLTSSSCCLY